MFPHVEVSALDRTLFRYSTVWQRHNLVFVALPAAAGDDDRAYIARLIAFHADFAARNGRCIVTRDPVEGLAPPAVVVADRWGEIVHVATAIRTADLPLPDELLEWLDYLETRCPECEAESR
jgi:hypothetical protein